jgi:hypothetical protein
MFVEQALRSAQLKLVFLVVLLVFALVVALPHGLVSLHILRHLIALDLRVEL